MPYWQPSELESVLAIAGKQQGNVTTAQLMAAGLGKAAIAYRSRRGTLFRVHLGAYGVGRPPSTPLEHAAAAVLACGDRAVLSHRSALSLWGLVSDWRFPLHVTCAAQRTRPGIIVHRARGLTPADVRERQDIRVTSPARTLLDCTPDLTVKRLSRLAADARRAGLLAPGRLADVAARFPYHRGRKQLLELIDARVAPTRSELEDAFLIFCARFGLPTPLINTVVAGHEVDALFPSERLIVELDGWDFHRDRHNFEADRDRDADTLAAGLATVRVTWQRMHGRPEREAERLLSILASRRRAAG